MLEVASTSSRSTDLITRPRTATDSIVRGRVDSQQGAQEITFSRERVSFYNLLEESRGVRGRTWKENAVGFGEVSSLI